MADVLTPEERPTSVAEARRLGAHRYFTGKPCKNGHIAERFASTCACLECNRLQSLRWVAANVEKDKALRAERYPHIAAELNERRRAAWHRLTVEERRERNARNYAKNREKIIAHVAKWAAKNPEKVRRNKRAWDDRNPEQRAAGWRNRNARLKRAAGRHSGADIEAIARAQGNRCAYCRVKLTRKTRRVDHIVPLARGGSNDRANLQLTCEHCNCTKSARDPIVFARLTGRLL